MSKIHCEVVEDLLPLYVENMASPSSRVLVEEHLKDCEGCRRLEGYMRKQVQIPRDIDTAPLKKIKKVMFRKKVTVAVLTVLILSLLGIFTIIHFTSPVTVSYEQISHTLSVYDSDSVESGKVLSVKTPEGTMKREKFTDEDGVQIELFCFYTTKWNLLHGYMTQHCYELQKDTKRVYYYPSTQRGESVLLYEAKDAPENKSSGMVILPRMILNYYLIIASALSVFGFFMCVLLRKSGDKFKKALKLTLIPLVYTISSFILLAGKSNIYDTEYYFSGIMIVSIVGYIIGYWIIEFLDYHRRIPNKNL
ncbi:MAG: zf-HC2 domain-containing protein [Lachnospiraceae bacterium]|nr:zf-HC2 domain-containing protein [Lachnospiraceae bacterium]